MLRQYCAADQAYDLDLETTSTAKRDVLEEKQSNMMMKEKSIKRGRMT